MEIASRSLKGLSPAEISMGLNPGEDIVLVLDRPEKLVKNNAVLYGLPFSETGFMEYPSVMAGLDLPGCQSQRGTEFRFSGYGGIIACADLQKGALSMQGIYLHPDAPAYSVEGHHRIVRADTFPPFDLTKGPESYLEELNGIDRINPRVASAILAVHGAASFDLQLLKMQAQGVPTVIGDELDLHNGEAVHLQLAEQTGFIGKLGVEHRFVQEWLQARIARDINQSNTELPSTQWKLLQSRYISMIAGLVR